MLLEKSGDKAFPAVSFDRKVFFFLSDSMNKWMFFRPEGFYKGFLF